MALLESGPRFTAQLENGDLTSKNGWTKLVNISPITIGFMVLFWLVVCYPSEKYENLTENVPNHQPVFIIVIMEG